LTLKTQCFKGRGNLKETQNWKIGLQNGQSIWHVKRSWPPHQIHWRIQGSSRRRCKAILKRTRPRKSPARKEEARTHQQNLNERPDSNHRRAQEEVNYSQQTPLLRRKLQNGQDLTSFDAYDMKNHKKESI